MLLYTDILGPTSELFINLFHHSFIISTYIYCIITLFITIARNTGKINGFYLS
jgi:hypothetical protein